MSIRGPKDDVEKAKQQLLELTNEKQLTSYSVEVRAKVQHHKFLIGKNGANIRKVIFSSGYLCVIIIKMKIKITCELIFVLDKRIYRCPYNFSN